MLIRHYAVPVLTVAAVSLGICYSCVHGAEPDVALSPVRANQSMTTNALLGFINAEPVFVNDMIRPIDEQLRNLAKSSRTLGDFKEGARALIDGQMRTYVTSILVNSSAKAALSEEDRGKLDLYLNKSRVDLLAKYGGSLALADQALKSQNSSVEKELADKRRFVTVQLYLSKKILPKIIITRDMVVQDYEKGANKWDQEAEVDLFTITLPISRWLREPGVGGELGPIMKNPTPAQIQQAKTAAMNEAMDINAQLKKGANFAQLAEDKHSVDGRAMKGGLTPGVKRGSLVNQKEEDYIFSLPANTLGEPLLLDDPDPLKATVVVIKTGDRKEPRHIPFGEAQEDIRKKLHTQQYDQLSNDYMKTLYKAAAIERVDQMTNTALDVAVARYATQ